MPSRRKWTKRLLVASLALLAVCAVCCAGCGPQSRVIPEIGIHLEKGSVLIAPTDGWFLSDSELKGLFMQEYDGTQTEGAE